MVDFKDYTYKMDRTLEVLQEDFGARPRRPCQCPRA